jgi:D-lactate dehydrogenase
MDTCAACNLCSLRCPVGIETGTMIMGKRADKRGGVADRVAALAASATGVIETGMGVAAGTQTLARMVVGHKAVDGVAGALNTWSKHKLPRPGRAMRRGPGRPEVTETAGTRGRVLYFPACASRMFGPPKTEFNLLPVTEAMVALLSRAGYQPVVPDKLNGQCCGQPFQSKGFPEQAKKLGARLSARLDKARGPGVVASVTDMSTCALHLQKDGEEMRDSAEFLLEAVLPHLSIGHRLDVVAVHHNCSAQRMDEPKLTEALARACAKDIAVLNSVTCCGFAGDKGLYQPELNAHALRFAGNDIPPGCRIGVSTVATCAMGLSEHLGMPFVALASLLEYVSRP